MKRDGKMGLGMEKWDGKDKMVDVHVWRRMEWTVDCTNLRNLTNEMTMFTRATRQSST
jgi:hypothetical protein